MFNAVLLSQTDSSGAGYQLERLYSDVTSLCGRIELLPCRTARDHLAQSGEGREPANRSSRCSDVSGSFPLILAPPLPPAEMAKRVANILRVVLSLQQGDGADDPLNIPLAQLAPHISRLPMPEDYALEELRGLTQSYLRQLVVSQ